MSLHLKRKTIKRNIKIHDNKMFHSNFYLSYMNSNGVDNNGWEDR